MPVVESMSFVRGGAAIASGNYRSKDVDDEMQEILWVIKAKTNMLSLLRCAR
jgi:hypothetical protein